MSDACKCTRLRDKKKKNCCITILLNRKNLILFYQSNKELAKI
jgi:hypothetical protein